MKKIVVMLLVLIMSVSMIGCKKNEDFSEEASIKNEIMNELSEEDKNDINEALGEESGFGGEEEAAKTEELEEFTADDFPCDPVVLNSKWSDCYYQVADVIVQEYHNVPIMEVVEAFENSKLKFKPKKFVDMSYEDFDFEEEFPINQSEVEFDMVSEYGYVHLNCSIDKESNKDSIIKIKDAYFTYVSSAGFNSDHEELENCRYVAKGFCPPNLSNMGEESEYSYRDLDKVLDDDMVEEDKMKASGALKLTDDDSSFYIYDQDNMNLAVYEVLPDDIITGQSETAVRRLIFYIGENNRYYLAEMKLLFCIKK